MSAHNAPQQIIDEMNALLGQELGRNEYGEPYFSWRWSEDMFWPAFTTGETETKEAEVALPIIGGGTETAIMQTAAPVYRRDRQCRRFDTWYIAKWLTPWELISGPSEGNVRHGQQYNHPNIPSDKALMETWQRLFPGADFPAKGWRIPTDAYLPAGPDDENWVNSPHGKTEPNLQDTWHFIREVKFQTSRPFAVVEADMLAKEDEKNRRDEARIGEECADGFTAFLNPEPGKRNSFVSFPWSKKDRER